MARIAVIVSNPCTGDARVIKMARAAVAGGHEVHVFATSGINARPFETVQGVHFHRLDWRPGDLMSFGGLVPLLRRVSRRLAARLIKRLTPFVKYRLFSEVFAPHVAAIEPDLVHAHDLICLPAAADAARLAGARLVYDAHELELHRNPPLPWLQKKMVGRVEARYTRQADAVITVGRLVGGELARHIRRDDVHVLYNSPPLDACPRSIRRDLRLDAQVPLMVYVGKVTTGRGVGDMLALLPKMPGVVFATVGPCDLRTRVLLDRQCERLGLTARFRILPPVPFEQVVAYIGGCDLGVISVEPITLSYRYCMPNKLFELAFANVPIVSNKLDEIEEFIGEFGNGEVVDFASSSALAYTMFRMLEEKPRYVMGPQAQERLHARYSWAAQSAKLLAIYDAALARRAVQ